MAAAPKPDIDAEAAARRLSAAIQFRTVSSLDDDPRGNDVEFDKLHAYLADAATADAAPGADAAAASG